MKIVIDDKIPFIKGVFEPYADEVVYLPGAKTSPEDVHNADALITRTRTKCNRALLEGSAVKVIATATIGYDHIDTVWAESAGILWENAPGCNSWSVRQYISSVLCVLSLNHGFSLEGRSIGIVGVGNVGTKVAAAAKTLGMNVILCDPPRARREGGEAFTDIDTLISRADIVTLHVPLNRDGQDCTYHLIDSERLSRFRKDQILINSSRGPVVDNKALKAALEKDALKAAVLDVWEDEPEPDPDLVELLDIATPHIAGYSADGKANGTTMAVRTVARALGIEALKSWKASGVTEPSQALEFTIDCGGKSTEETLKEAILHTYDVREDSLRLRSDLNSFEAQRGNYPVRREPSAFSVRLQNASQEIQTKIQEFEFNLI